MIPNLVQHGKLSTQTKSRVGRYGYSLLELLVVVSVFGILAVSLGSVMLVSTKTLSITTSSAAQVSDSAKISSLISSEISLAIQFFEQSDEAIEFSVTDRDGDQEPEIIRYEYTGPPQGTLSQSIWFSETKTTVTSMIARDLAHFQFIPRQSSTPAISVGKYISGIDQLLFHRETECEELSSKTGLLITRNQTSQTTEETTITSFMQSFGMTVNRISQSSSHSEFQTAIATADLVYIPSNLTSFLLEGKLDNITIGIVNANINMAEQLGIGNSDSSLATSSTLEISADSNQLADGHTIGILPLFSEPKLLSTLSSDPLHLSPDFKTVGGFNGSTALGYLDAHQRKYNSADNSETVLGNTALTIDGEVPVVGENHHATKTTLATEADFRYLTVYLAGDDTLNSSVRFGIYQDDNGVPAELLAETEVGQLTGSHSRWYSLSFPETLSLEEGNYWIAASTSGPISFYYQAGGSRRQAVSQSPPSVGLMDPWPEDSIVGSDSSLLMHASLTELKYTQGKRIQVPFNDQTLSVNDPTTKGLNLLRTAFRWATTPSTAPFEATESVSNSQSVGQFFCPELPSDQEGWYPTRIALKVRPLHSASNARFRLSLYQASEAGLPLQLLERTPWINLDVLFGDTFRWHTMRVKNRVKQPSGSGICITLEADSDENAMQVICEQMIGSPQSHFMRKQTAENWSPSGEDEQMSIYVFGRTYQTR